MQAAFPLVAQACKHWGYNNDPEEWREVEGKKDDVLSASARLAGGASSPCITQSSSYLPPKPKV